MVSGEQSVQKATRKEDATPRSKAMPAEKELALLENDERLNDLLDALESGKTLSDEEHNYVNDTLDRIDELMVQLGIDLGDDDEEEEPSDKKDDILNLLKHKD